MWKRQGRRFGIEKADSIEYDWPETGRLEILTQFSHSAVLRFTPSEVAVEKALSEAAKSPLRGGKEKVSPNTT